MTDLLSLQEEMKKILKPRRYLHVLGVQYTSASLAMKYHEDLMKAQIAGLLHDCAKNLSDDIILDECMKYGLSISEFERDNLYLLHGKLGACYAKIKYGIGDEDILHAIAYHTTGRPNMSLLEKIVFVSDYIEPARNADRVKQVECIRPLAYEDLDRTVYEIAKSTLDYLKENSKNIDTTTVETMNYYKNIINKE